MADDFKRVISKMDDKSSGDGPKGIPYFLKRNLVQKSFGQEKYTFTETTDRILESNCYHMEDVTCNLCLYNEQLNIPHLPEIVFPNNSFKIGCDDGTVINFVTLDALKEIDVTKWPEFKVGSSEEWLHTREEYKNITPSGKPFDWSYTSFYKGTLGEKVAVETTDEKIDYEKLKRRDPITNYGNFTLYEDELHDNGLARMEIKYRSMAERVFVLQRFFLRIDNVMVRIVDTRLYHENESGYWLREWSLREQKVADMDEELKTNLKDVDYLAANLPLQDVQMEKLIF
uniref:TIP41-like protein n=1 Tax=Rhabditophanes sp. KR3021 TaxID=114890 RepID=A0AC35U3B8_9BILA